VTKEITRGAFAACSDSWCPDVLLDRNSQSDFVECEYLDELGEVHVLVYQLPECKSIR